MNEHTRGKRTNLRNLKQILLAILRVSSGVARAFPDGRAAQIEAKPN